jgi:hypothetical protein
VDFTKWSINCGRL